MGRSCLIASILIVGYVIKCHCFVPSQRLVYRHRHTNSNSVVKLSLPQLGTSSRPEQDYGNSLVEQQTENNDAAFDMNDISDAEALLACRAYLQRKNRLGWHRAKERKELREQATQESGFFWESSEQSDYWNKREEEDIDFDQGEASQKRQVEQLSSDETQEQTGIFTEMPTGPNARSEIRSRVKKEQWQDPQFRKRWYESRWGDHVKPTDESKKQLRLQTKLLEIPTAILDSPEFAMLTESEIDEAIISYVVSNRKRSVALKKHEPKEPSYDEPEIDIGAVDKPIHRDSLFSVSEDVLRERQRQRSERAKKAYQTRIETAATKMLASKASDAASASSRESPKQALLRIVVDLDANLTPSAEAVITMMKAKRLCQRKEVLRRILTERFEVRGKCYPLEEGPAMYVTEASVAQLGQLVIRLISGQAHYADTRMISSTESSSEKKRH